MLEKENIQLRGFKNISERGNITGFQVPFRSTYYRGVWLSQLTEVTLTIDGEQFAGDQITWKIGDKTFAQKDLINNPETYWPIYEPAIFIVEKPGGLTLGVHDVEVAYGYTSSYTPYPNADNDMPNIRTYQRKMTLAG